MLGDGQPLAEVRLKQISIDWVHRKFGGIDGRCKTGDMPGREQLSVKTRREGYRALML